MHDHWSFLFLTKTNKQTNIQTIKQTNNDKNNNKKLVKCIIAVEVVFKLIYKQTIIFFLNYKHCVCFPCVCFPLLKAFWQIRITHRKYSYRMTFMMVFDTVSLLFYARTSVSSAMLVVLWELFPFLQNNSKNVLSFLAPLKHIKWL